jgi:hypothetical protein
MNEQFLVLWSVSNPKMERCTQLVYRERSEEKVALALGRFNPLSLTSHSPLGSLFSIWESVLACRNKGEEGSEKLGVHLDFFHFFKLPLQSWRTFLIQFSPVLIARKNNNLGSSNLPVAFLPSTSQDLSYPPLPHAKGAASTLDLHFRWLCASELCHLWYPPVNLFFVAVVVCTPTNIINIWNQVTHTHKLTAIRMKPGLPASVSPAEYQW